MASASNLTINYGGTEFTGVLDILRQKGSSLTDYDGKTPPPAVFPNPLDSSNSPLSEYKGVTPPKYWDNRPKE